MASTGEAKGPELTQNPLAKYDDFEAKFEHGVASEKPSFAAAREWAKSNLPHRVPDHAAAAAAEEARSKRAGMTPLRRFLDPFITPRPTGYRLRRPGETGGKPYDVCSATVEDIGDFGLGVGLYFNTLIFMGSVLLVCGLVSIPVIQDNIDFQDSLNGSIPSQLKGSFAGVKDLSSKQGWTDIICCLFLIAAAIASNKLEDKKVEQIDVTMQTAQDYSVVVKNPFPTVTDPDEYHRHFSQFGEVVAITIALDNGPLLRAKALLTVAEKRLKLAILRERKRRHGEGLQDLEHLPRPNPCVRCLQRVGFKRNRRYWEERVSTLTRQVESYYREGFKFVPVKVFIVFEHEVGQRTCLAAMQKGLLERMRTEDSMEDRLVVEAPEPSDIIWENLHLSWAKRLMKQTGSYLGSAFVLGISFWVLYALSSPGSEADNEQEATSNVNGVVTFGTAAFIVALNQMLPRIMKFLVAFFEKHVTFSSFQASLMLKLVIVRCMNTAVLSFLITRNSEFLTSETISKVQNILLADLVLTNFLRLVDPYTLFRRFFLGRKALTQDQLNELWSGAPWNLGERYTDIFKTLFVCLFYSALLPTGFFVSAACFFAIYWLDKYLLLRHWSVAPEIDETLAKGSRRFYTLCVYAHLWVTMWFYTRWPFVGDSGRGKDLTTDSLSSTQEDFAVVYSIMIGVLSLYLLWILLGAAIHKAVVHLLYGEREEVGKANPQAYTECKGITGYLPHAMGFGPGDIDLGEHRSVVKYYKQPPQERTEPQFGVNPFMAMAVLGGGYGGYGGDTGFFDFGATGAGMEGDAAGRSKRTSSAFAGVMFAAGITPMMPMQGAPQPTMVAGDGAGAPPYGGAGAGAGAPYGGGPQYPPAAAGGPQYPPAAAGGPQYPPAAAGGPQYPPAAAGGPQYPPAAAPPGPGYPPASVPPGPGYPPAAGGPGYPPAGAAPPGGPQYPPSAAGPDYPSGQV